MGRIHHTLKCGQHNNCIRAEPAQSSNVHSPWIHQHAIATICFVRADFRFFVLILRRLFQPIRTQPLHLFSGVACWVPGACVTSATASYRTTQNVHHRASEASRVVPYLQYHHPRTPTPLRVSQSEYTVDCEISPLFWLEPKLPLLEGGKWKATRGGACSHLLLTTANYKPVLQSSRKIESTCCLQQENPDPTTRRYCIVSL